MSSGRGDSRHGIMGGGAAQRAAATHCERWTEVDRYLASKYWVGDLTFMRPTCLGVCIMLNQLAAGIVGMGVFWTIRHDGIGNLCHFWPAPWPTGPEPLLSAYFVRTLPTRIGRLVKREEHDKRERDMGISIRRRCAQPRRDRKNKQIRAVKFSVRMCFSIAWLQ